MEILSNLEFCFVGSAFHCLIMNHSIEKDPEAVRNRQKVGDYARSPRRRVVAGGDTSQMVVLESGPFHG